MKRPRSEIVQSKYSLYERIQMALLDMLWLLQRVLLPKPVPERVRRCGTPRAQVVHS